MMKQPRIARFRRWSVCLLLVTGSIFLAAAGTLAGLGRYWWGDAGWYLHSDPDYRLQAARRALERGEHGRAEQAILVLEADGYKDQAAFLRGQELVLRALGSNRDPAARRELLVSAIKELNRMRDPGDLRGDAAALVGRCYLEMKQPRQAEHAFQYALSLNPDQVDAHRGLAALYYDQGAARQAMHHLEAVAALEPEDGRSYRLMGLICKNMQQYGQAVECYQKSLTCDRRGQKSEPIRQELAECFVKETRFAEALQALEGWEPEPEDRTAVAALRAQALQGLGRTAEAGSLLDRVLTRGHSSPDLLCLRAKLDIESGRETEAVALLQKGLDMEPRDYGCRYQLVQTYLRLGRRKEAEEQRRILAETQKSLEELTRLEQEAAARPWERRVRLHLAELCDRLGQPGDATLWRQAADACPPDLASPRSEPGASKAAPLPSTSRGKTNP